MTVCYSVAYEQDDIIFDGFLCFDGDAAIRHAKSLGYNEQKLVDWQIAKGFLYYAKSNTDNFGISIRREEVESLFLQSDIDKYGVKELVERTAIRYYPYYF